MCIYTHWRFYSVCVFTFTLFGKIYLFQWILLKFTNLLKLRSGKIFLYSTNPKQSICLQPDVYTSYSLGIVMQNYSYHMHVGAM